MRLTSRLALAIATTTAALAFTTVSAQAQEDPVEVINEATEAHCDFAAGNCNVHVTGVSTLTGHVLGFELQASACNDEFRALLDEDGTGHIYEYNSNVGTISCTHEACTTGSTQDEWPIHSAGESGPNVGHLRLNFCLQRGPGSDKINCEIEVDVAEEGSHHYEFSAVDAVCPSEVAGVTGEVDGSWEIEPPDPSSDAIEIIHF